MNQIMKSIGMVLVGFLVGMLLFTSLMVWNMKTVPDGHAWMLYDFELPMPSSELPDNADLLDHWQDGDRVYVEVLHSGRHLPPSAPPSGN